jgi:soluble lytic murein transglycosylase-like protein
MPAIALSAALALAATCQHAVAPTVIVAMAQRESGLDPAAVHVNSDGSVDVGLMQINSRNWAWLGLTRETAMDPCRSIAAGAAVLTAFSQYNSGSPTRSLPYAMSVAAKVSALRGVTNSPALPSATGEDVDLNDRPAGISTLAERDN